MTRLELRDLLDERVGWKQPTQTSFTVTAANNTSEGGRYFQDEHEFVKISYIQEFMEKPSPTESEVNAYLAELRQQVTLHVIDEVFMDMNINDIDFTGRANLFDAAISKRMVIKISEILFSSVRRNSTKRLSEDQINKFFFDINGDPNYPDKQGISSAYKKEKHYIKDLFNSTDLLDVHTLGVVSNWDDDQITI